MSDIPREALSGHFQGVMRGRRLVAAVFATYTFEPGFFEQDVLPLFFDIGFSHHPGIRLAQLEKALREVDAGVAVYYDSGGLRCGDVSAHLDVRRVAVRHHTGVFHPKNVLLLVEDPDTDSSGNAHRALIVSALSANLTRSGWWKNVEVCQSEEIGEEEKTRLGEDVASFLDALKKKAPGDTDHRAIDAMRNFLKRTEAYQHRSSAGHLHPHFYSGSGSVAEFLEQAGGRNLQGTCLEIISPFFDDAEESAPLQELMGHFHPRETRVYLPHNERGEATVRKELYDSVQAQSNVSWGSLPDELLRLGKSDEAGLRFVHAKVYRFFTRKPKSEWYFIGSPNLTRAAHCNGGNMESGLFVEVVPTHVPDFWLKSDEKAPRSFVDPESDTEGNESRNTQLSLRYHWDQEAAFAWWDATKSSPPLVLSSQGVFVGQIGSVPPRDWTVLDEATTTNLRGVLKNTSFLTVSSEGEGERTLLVQEEGMWRKESVVVNLTVADILRYWSLLTSDQRAEFMENNGIALHFLGYTTDLFVQKIVLQKEESLFDRMAGYFHAFGCLERSVCASLATGRPRDAEYRLFGRSFDSLGRLLERIVGSEEVKDVIDRYVIILCARQLCNEIANRFPDFWSAHNNEADVLASLLASSDALRSLITAEGGEDIQRFLDWFEPLFLRRLVAVVKEVA